MDMEELTREFKKDGKFFEGYSYSSSQDEKNKKVIKQESCYYCYQNNPDSIVQCQSCSLWFCNRSVGKNNVSHVVYHMVRTKHRDLILHKDSPLGAMQLECYNCGSRNAFSLGFVPSSAESVVLLLCRNPCAYQHTLREINCSLDEWQPIICDRKLLSWLVKVPPHDEKDDIITLQQMTKLEDYRMQGIDPLCPSQDKALECAHTKLVYESPEEYSEIYNPLINFESDIDRKIKESQAQSNVIIRFDVGISRRKTVFFTLPQSDSEFRMLLGDEVKLKHNTCDTIIIGQIIKIPNSYGEEIGIETVSPIPSQTPTTGWTVEFVWKPITFQRLRYAIKNFVKNSTQMSEYIRSKILGKDVEEETFKLILPKRFSAPGLPELNHSQVYAIKQALQRPLSLIQGPPGTGKTVTSATLVYHIIKQCGGQVLVCAPSNIAVDQLAEKIHKTGLNVLRICAKSREDIDTRVSHLSLHNQIKKMENAPELSKLINLRDEQGELTEEDCGRYAKLRSILENALLTKADVVCTTCIGAGDHRLRSFKFQCVILDESTQATEPECLVPIVLCSKQLILVGDHCQLGPVVMSKPAASCGLSRTLFERLIELGVKPFRLQVQYRMHPSLSEFSSNVFYDGTLQNGVTVAERSHPSIDFPWPNPDKPMFFYAVNGQEEISSSGTSYLNRTEATAVETFTTRLMKGGVKPQQIGIITPYEGQRAYLVNYIQQRGHFKPSTYSTLEIASVDAFQGREKDYIIMSCVRSNTNQGIGFLNDSRRLNVAITRAKYGLIIVGNPRMLIRHSLWNALVCDYKDKNLLVEGPINNMREAQILINKTQSNTFKKNANQRKCVNDEPDSLSEKYDKPFDNIYDKDFEEKINSFLGTHDRMNILLPITDAEAEKLNECSSSVPLNVLIPSSIEEKPTISQQIEDSDNLKNDIISFARSFAVFDLGSILQKFPQADSNTPE